VENSDLQLELNMHVLSYLKIALKPPVVAAEDVNGDSDHGEGHNSPEGSPRRKKRRKLHVKSPKAKRKGKNLPPDNES